MIFWTAAVKWGIDAGEHRRAAGALRRADESRHRQTNEELERKAKQLPERTTEVERKNKEVELARRALEDKAAELALTSKYRTASSSWASSLATIRAGI